MLTVVIPLYNKRKSIARAVQSVLRQTHHDFALIVVDDGSTDGSREVVEQFADDRIKVLSQENGGVAAARNAGVRAAETAYVCFLDADDEWQPNFLRAIASLVELQPMAAMYSARHRIVDAQGRDALGTLSLGSGFFGEVVNFYDTYRKSQSLINSSSVCVRKDCLLSIGGFPSGKKVGEDVFVWLRLAEASPVMFTADVLSIAYQDAENRTASRVVERVPYYLEYYLESSDGLRVLASNHAMRRFIAHYSLIYSLQAVCNDNASLPRYYVERWRGVSSAAALVLSLVANLPPPLARLGKSLRQTRGRLRWRFGSHSVGAD